MQNNRSVRAQPSAQTLNQRERPSKYRLAWDNAAELKKLVSESPESAWQSLFELEWEDCDAIPQPPESKDHNLLKIHGFAPLGPMWKSIDVLVSHCQWRTLPNLMQGTYGQVLLSEFFKVDLHVVQGWIEEKGYSAMPQGDDLVWDVEVAGKLRLIGYSSDQPITVDDLMRTEAGRMLVRSQLTGDLIRRWEKRSQGEETKHAREAIQALAAARVAKPSQAYRYGCFEMIRCVMERIVATPEAA